MCDIGGFLISFACSGMDFLKQILLVFFGIPIHLADFINNPLMYFYCIPKVLFH